jgi:hypothetical protein
MKTEKIYAIYKNGIHVGNAEGQTPKLAVWYYCTMANIPVNYTIYKAKKAIQGKHYLKQEIENSSFSIVMSLYESNTKE